MSSLRHRYKKFTGINPSDYKSQNLVNKKNQEVSNIIASAINEGKPFLLTRFGSEEIKWYVHYKLLSSNYFSRVWSYISCKTDTWTKEGRIIDNMTVCPKSLSTTEAFIKAIDDAIPQIDLLGSWLKLEQTSHIQSKLKCKNFAFLVDIEPYYHPHPWSASLEGKRVLVIHPMTKSIISQHKKRSLLFKDQHTLPDFDLLTIQAKYFDDPIYNTWEKIYHYYLDEISKLKFDVAILGCGSWGMPVAAEIKKLGKPSLHLGGATQILFGIIGNRWETLYPELIENYVNEHWVRPLKEETPTWAKNYDRNSYW